MKRYLLDTNHLGDAITKTSVLRDRICQMRRQGSRFGTCWPALFELEMGVVQTKDPMMCRRNVRILLREVRIRPLDWDLLNTFGHVHLLLKKRGRILSLVDKILGALAMVENATLLTADLDFQALPEIRTENWLP
jgi:predicted nucleic acid-binding protein